MKTQLQRVWKLLLIVTLVISGWTVMPQAEASSTSYISFYYDTFADDGRLQMNGSTSITNNQLRLTPAAATQSGSAFNKDKISLKDSSSFSTYFVFNMSDAGGYVGHTGNNMGADGFVFVIQTVSSTAGSSGAGIGYEGINPSVGIEFDVWKNSPPEDNATSKNDPNNNHIALVLNGNNYHSDPSYVKSDLGLDLNSGSPVHAWVDYNGQTGTIEVRLSTSATRPASADLEVGGLDLRTVLQADEVFVGFTAATGGAYQKQTIDSWYFDNRYAPIDVGSIDYEQAPTSYVLDAEEQPDGTVKVTLTAVGGSTQSGIPIVVTATNGAIVTPGTVITDAAGEAFVTVSNPTDDALTTTVRAEGPGGIYDTLIINFPKPPQSAAPAGITANATTDKVTVPNVPAGTAVKVYDENDNEIGTAINNGAGSAAVTVDIASGLSHNQPISVTLTEPNKLESTQTPATALAEQSPAPTGVTANSTANSVTFPVIPAGAVVKVYDENDNEIGSATNTGTEAAPVTVDVTSDLSHNEAVTVTLTEIDKLESARAAVTALAEQSAAPSGIAANSTTDQVTIPNVPAGTIVKVYDENNNEIGTVTNTGLIPTTVTVDIAAGLTTGQQLNVTLTEPDKLESTPTAATALAEQSASPAGITANATTDKVVVPNVPAGAIVKVYDENNNEIGAATNAGVATASVTVDVTSDLIHNEGISVTLTEVNKLESTATPATTLAEQSAPPAGVTANATTDEVTVPNVPAGATVKVYDENNNEIGTATNNGSTPATVTVEIAGGLDADQELGVTITELNKLESTATPATALAEQSTPPAGVTANATTDEVTVPNVPAGAIVKVYDENNNEIGVATNAGAATASVTVDVTSDLIHNEGISVTLTEINKLESAATPATAVAEQSVPPAGVTANATTDEVTVPNVPAGATVKVYDENNNEIGTATNNGSTPATVTVEIAGGLDADQELGVTITEPNKLESAATPATAVTEQSAPPTGVTANATTDEVTVPNVPAGATVKVYDENNNEIGTATNNGSTPATVTVEIAGGLDADQELGVTITELNKLESTATPAIALAEQSTPPAGVTANATTDEVTVPNVPAGATVKVYDENNNEIGTATNNGSTPATVTVEIAGGLDADQELGVTIIELNKLESSQTPATAVAEQSVPPAGVTANSTTDEVTVPNVPAGAAVKVYDENNNEIGTATNNGSIPGTVTVEIAGGLDADQELGITITEPNKLESSQTPATALAEQSAPPAGVTANATTDEVTVPNVPAGATVKVYDENNNEIGTATNNGSIPATVTVEIAGGLDADQELGITITEPNKLESTATPATALAEQSAPPAGVTANATTDEVTVPNVPAGATVKVYDENNNEIGTATNTGSIPTTVTVDIAAGLTTGQQLNVTLTEPDKLESSQTPATALAEQSTPPAGVTANATTDEVTVPNVPAGATVKVYDENNNEIGTATNAGAATASVTVDVTSNLTHNEGISVTLTEVNKLESTATPATALAEQSAPPTGVTANATTDEVTVPNVPAGATVKVYDENNNEIGTATNNGSTPATVTVEIAGGLDADQELGVTITEPNKLESTATPATALAEQSAPPVGVTANATTDEVTVPNVPAGATVKVYDENNNEIGTATNAGSIPATVTVEIAGGLDADQELEVTIIELNKLESSQTPATAVAEQSVPPAGVTANATTDEVTVPNVPAGATVKVYDENNNEIGTATNAGSTPGTVSVEIAGGLNADQELGITITELNKLESTATPAIALAEQSTPPAGVTANATTDEVTVPNVPAGATVKVYDENNNEIGTATNAGSIPATVTVEIVGGLDADQELGITITEPNKLESAATPATAVTEQSTPPTGVTANATTDEVTVPNVPAGATVKVYDENNNEIGTATNNGSTPATVTVEIAGGLDADQELGISITELNKLESTATLATALAEQSAPPTGVTANATTDEVTVPNVPAGATVKVYDENNNEIGTATNNGSTPATVTVEIAGGLEHGQELGVTITEPSKLESTVVTVKAPDLSDEEAVEEAARGIKIIYTEGDTWESVTSPIFLITVGLHDTNVEWSASKPSVIVIPQSGGNTLTATVNRKATEQSVIVSAKISKNGFSKTRTFLLIVKADGVTKIVNEQYSRDIVLEGQTGSNSLPIIRIDVHHPDQSTSIIDKVIMTQSKTQALIDANPTGDRQVTIDMNELAGDEPDEFAIEVTSDSVSGLANNDFELHAQTAYATLSYTQNVVQQFHANGMDMFIRVVPIKQANQQQQIENHIPKTYDGKSVSVVGTPLEIETNHIGYDVELFIPFSSNGIDPDKVLLDNLRVYIEHSDGEIAIQQGAVVRDNNGLPIGLSIQVNKFSTFTIIELKTITGAVVSDIPVNTSLPVNIETGSVNKGVVVEQMDMTRKAAADGTKKDTLELSTQKAADAVHKATAAGGNNVRIVVPDEKDEVSELTLTAAGSALDKLITAKTRLEVKTVNGILGLPTAALQSVNNELTVRLTPIKNEQAQNAILNSALQNHNPELSRELQLVGRPVNIETNVVNEKTTLILPIPTKLIPQNGQERASFLESLIIYGSVGQAGIWLDNGTIIELGNGNYGIEVEISRNGTYAILAASVRYDAHYKYVNGYPDGTFRPERSITRAEVAAIIARNLPSEYVSRGSNIPYNDMNGKHWATNAIETVTKAGLMQGYPDGSFRPDASITRAELAMVAAAYRKLTGQSEAAGRSAYSDVTDHWAFTAIDSLYAAGVMQGYPDGSFRPNAKLTRAEAVTTMNRLFGRGPLYGVEKSSWPDVQTTHWAFHEIEEASNDHEYSLREEGGEQLVKFIN